MNSDTQDNYSYLVQKLDQFIRKFYTNQLLRGLLYFITFFLVSTLLFSAIEYFANSGIAFRTFLFWFYVGLMLLALSGWVLNPLLKIYKLGKRISHRQAAMIVGAHFPEIKDKLLNTLQLKEGKGQGSKELIEAGIAQKIQALKPIPFTMAVNFKENRKYLKYAIIPLVIALFLLIRLPDVILGSSARILSFNQEFLPVAPFNFNLQNKELEVLMHSDFDIELLLNGAEIPAEAHIDISGKLFRMNRKKNNEYTYALRNLTQSTSFRFAAGGFSSQTYTLKVLPKPLLKSFSIELSFPSYTGKKGITLENIGDLEVPEGTSAHWRFNAENTDDVIFRFSNDLKKAERNGKERFGFQKNLVENESYYIKPINPFVSNPDSMAYTINIIKDQFPTITVESRQDSQALKSYFFTGDLSDDYGLSGLVFYYKFTKSDDAKKLTSKFISRNIGIKRETQQRFFHHWDLNQINYQAGDELVYFFEVWDNDAVNGRKSTKTQQFSIKAPTKKEIKEQVSENAQELKSQMQSLVRQAAEMQNEFEKAKNKLLEKDRLNWEDKEELKEMFEKQKELQKQVKDVSEKFKSMKQQQEQFSEINPELAEKYEKVMELFEKLMSEDMKEMYEELEKLMNENLDRLRDELEDTKLDNKELEKELDVALEQFKRIEVEQKLEETLTELDELAKEQEDLAKKTENKEATSEELKKEQDKLNEKFEELNKDLEDALEKNEDLEQPLDLDDMDEEQSDTKEEMEKSSDELENKKEKKASEHQKKAAQKMKEMKEKMEKSLSAAKAKSLELDYAAIRQLLENLLFLSFEQERILDELKEVNNYNPKFVSLAQQQVKLKADAQLIEDSLVALSKRVIQLSGFIGKELKELNFNMDKTMKFLSERNIPQSRSAQQYVMTHTNNLAVMLSEVMEQMQQQMGEAKPGDQNCNNPKNKGKGKKPKDSLGDMKKMQEQLNKQIGEMKDNMQKGKSPLSKELAKTAAQQQALRRELQRINEMKQQAGEKPSNELKEIEKLMDESETDLVNKQIDSETIRRQQEILSKLLEAEKAEREQEYDEERKGETATQRSNQVNDAFEEYKRKKMKEIELLNSLPPQLNPYYKGKVKEYFKTKEP